ncbi:hypothetical protein P154DRAFT_461042 [Amniculicola lignicola CBS 123094]|uniref:F-box domain-containing protein n=1 Tax=Amniculicola lignicola CBS 123094 TaxID=1392246 RepID=A0A6A5WN31_9PLEO|nr:hypothetical protein P154DRAFT_461042 [Amniculicola lignicola CBS 123094]
MPSLESLPNELIHEICSHTAFELDWSDGHPLLALSDTTKHLRSVIEEYSRVLLKRQANLDIRLPKKVTTSTVSRWLKWVSNTCWYCKKNSKRRAILDPTIICCSKCDRDLFPKMTMTDAMRKHRLSKLDLFTPNEKHPHLAPLLHGSYVCMGSPATMFAKADVLAREKLIQGQGKKRRKPTVIILDADLA